MSLIPIALGIGGVKTGWPGVLVSPIAMIDSGGGPIFLSDPNGVIFSSPGHNAAVSPAWISSSTNCECIRDSISVELGDSSQTITYVVDTARMPASAAGLTLVMCEDNYYMMGQHGMRRYLIFICYCAYRLHEQASLFEADLTRSTFYRKVRCWAKRKMS